MAKRILIAEDDEAIRKSVALFLEKLGYEVEETADGEEAIALVCDPYSEIQLLLLDVRMPGADGITVLSEMKKNRSTIPVVMMSNLDDDETVASAQLLGARGYLVKSNTDWPKLQKTIEDIFKV